MTIEDLPALNYPSFGIPMPVASVEQLLLTGNPVARKMHSIIADEETRRSFMQLMDGRSKHASKQLGHLDDAVTQVQVDIATYLQSIDQAIGLLQSHKSLAENFKHNILPTVKSHHLEASARCRGFETQPDAYNKVTVGILLNGIDCTTVSVRDMAKALYLSNFSVIQQLPAEGAYWILEGLSDKGYILNPLVWNLLQNYRTNGTIAVACPFQFEHLYCSKDDSEETLRGFVAIYLGLVDDQHKGFVRRHKNEHNLPVWTQIGNHTTANGGFTTVGAAPSATNTRGTSARRHV